MSGGGMSAMGSAGMYGGATPGTGMAQSNMGQQQYPGMASPQQQFGGFQPSMQQQQYPNSRTGMTGVGTTPGGFGAQGGGARPLSSASSSSQFGTSPFSSSSSRGRTSSLRGSMYGGRGRKKPSKKTLLAMLLFICAVVFVLLGD